jgi:Domain of unknown function(DUF2779)
MRISTSKFVAGVQCAKRLYLQVHQPELAGETSESAMTIMEQGQQVGLVAQQGFPGGVMVDDDHEHLDEAIRATRELVANTEIPAIFEATFETARVLVRTDILERRGRFGFRLVEVKSSTGMKPHYAYDLGVQAHVLTKAGVAVERSCLMHLNREYIYGGGNYDVSRLFVLADLTPEQTISETEISSRIGEQLSILNQPSAPDIKPGAHCTAPVLCEFYGHCNQELPTNHVSLLPNLRAGKVVDLLSMGIASLSQIPDHFPLSEMQRIALDAVKSGKMWMNPELPAALATLRYPLCFMDFETVYPALPRFPGMRPYDHIPFQWSVHRQEIQGGPIQHLEFLAEDTLDPRRPFLESLLRAVKGAGTIVVYNQQFESGRLNELPQWIPECRVEISDAQSKLWDLLSVIRKNVYHPAFGRSYSLKTVLPALLPEMSYANLRVAGGTQAGIAWMKLMDPVIDIETKRHLRNDLFRYCGQDTLALSELVNYLVHHEELV